MDPTPEDLQRELERLRRENEALKKKLGDYASSSPVEPTIPQQLLIPSAELEPLDRSAVTNQSSVDQVILDHLSGTKTIGIYALLKDNRCCFLACDLDGQGWQLDALAYLDICKRYGVPAYVERSRSGDGGHVWMFFSAPVKAETARQLGMRLLRQAHSIRRQDSSKT